MGPRWVDCGGEKSGGVEKRLARLPVWSGCGVVCRGCGQPFVMCPWEGGAVGELAGLIVGRWGRCLWVVECWYGWLLLAGGCALVSVILSGPEWGLG